MREVEAPGETASRNPTLVGSRRVTTGAWKQHHGGVASKGRGEVDNHHF